MPKQSQPKQPDEGKVSPLFYPRTIYTTEEQWEKFRVRKEEELEVNFPIFERRLPDLRKKREGEFVLMRKGRMLGFFSSKRDAYAEGNRRFKDCVFNVLEICDIVVDLGFRSRVL